MLDVLHEIWGELYWNPLDWLPWIGVQILFAAIVGAVLQWWFKIGIVAFLFIIVLSLSVNFGRLPAPALTGADLARMNAGLPQTTDSVTMENVSFSHRFLTYHLSSTQPLDEIFFKGLRESGAYTEQCKTLGKWLASRRIKRIEYVFTWPGGAETISIVDADCRTAV
ncbi:hypothetical protein NKI19_05480 [Mesorhizobium sp. M0751]|uniref:hypothetical protein n=1 Tax=unclassified Mesorhizobium TaxID=325217 RepID=UPI00333526FF